MIQDESQQARTRSSTSASTRKVTYWRKMKGREIPEESTVLLHPAWTGLKEALILQRHASDWSYEQEVSSSVFTGTKHVKKSGQPKATCVQWSESFKTLVLASTWHVDAAFTNTHKCNGFLCDLNCWTHPIQCSNMDNQLIMSHNTINRTQTHLLSC